MIPDNTWIRTMFERESEGVYRFGTRKIFIKLEMDKIMGKLLINNSACWWWVFVIR